MREFKLRRRVFGAWPDACGELLDGVYESKVE
jgi:hypothetical protein